MVGLARSISSTFLRSDTSTAFPGPSRTDTRSINGPRSPLVRGEPDGSHRLGGGILLVEMIRRYLDLQRTPRLVTAALRFSAAATILITFTNSGRVFRGMPSVISGEAPFPILQADHGP